MFGVKEARVVEQVCSLWPSFYNQLCALNRGTGAVYGCSEYDQPSG